MKKAIFATDRCTLFKSLASDIWSKIIHAHEVDMNQPEIGITADILITILHYSKHHLANFDLFARPSWDENTYGSDLDVFVEVRPNLFRWFALQAKVLKKNNRYDTLRDSSDGTMQWEKLSLLEGLTDCKAFYLLYNGKKGFNYIGSDTCQNSFDQEQFGCSLVEPTIIERLANLTTWNGNFIRPTFEDIHPASAQPWRILTCCNQDTENVILYSLDEIIKSNPNLLKVEYEQPQNEEAEDNLFDDLISKDNKPNSGEEIPIVEGNTINGASREARWNPSFRLIIKTTSNLIKSQTEI